MGYMQASEMNKLTDLDTALEWHLQYNHVPPVPLAMMAPAKKAIKAFEEGNPNAVIETPFPHNRYGYRVPAWAIVEALHLDAFIEQTE